MNLVKVINSFIPKGTIHSNSAYRKIYIIHILEDKTVSFKALCLDNVVRVLNLPIADFEFETKINLSNGI